VHKNRFQLPDAVLMLIALVALISYFWLVPSLHPDRYVNRRITEARAVQLASDYIGRSGYAIDNMRAVVELMREADVVNDLQDVYGREAFTKRLLPEEFRSLRPYYYRVSWIPNAASDIDGVDDDMMISFNGRSSSIDGGNQILFTVVVTTDGNIISMRTMNTDPIPVKPALRYLRSDATVAGWTHQIPAGVPDSMLVRNMGFNIASFRNADSQSGLIPDGPGPEVVVSQGLNYDLNRAEVLRLADYHIRKTTWQDKPMKVDTVVSVSNSLARVRYSLDDSLHHWRVNIELTVHPYGALNELNTIYTRTDTAAGINSSDIMELISVLTIAIIILSFLIVMIRRLDARLIDLKFALTDAILAGIFADLIILLGFLHANQFAVGGSMTQLFTLIPTLIAAGAGAALITFVISGSSESLARTSGFDMLSTLDLLKRGFFFNKAVGMSLIRGVAVGMIMVGFSTLPMFVISDIHLHFSSGETVFNSHNAVWPALEVIAKAGFISLLFSYTIFLGLGGFAWTIRNSWSIVAIMITIGGVLMKLIPMNIAPLWGGWLIGGIAMILLYALYRIYGFATILIGVFVFYVMWEGMSGWMLHRSPDLGMSLILGSMILTMFAFGLAAVAAGQDLEEIPEYVPSYVAELSSRERMERELEIARNVQLSFLPTSTPEILGYDISANCLPAFDTGGDFYDFIPLQDGKIAVIIGDVSGKGIQAAFYMTLIKGFVQSLSERIESPADILCEINRLFVRNAERGIFVTMLYGILDPSTGEFAFARAGHNPAILKPAKDANPRHLPSPGLGIGLVNDDRFAAHIRTTKIIIPEEGFVCLYTDGITEAMNLKRELYGDHRLLGQLRLIRDESAAGILTRIDHDLASFVGRAPQHDDMTLVIIRRSGPFLINYA
jgi:phosphoserine phosphatase RsbU/P